MWTVTDYETRVVHSETEKREAIASAARRGMQWVSTARVSDPYRRGEFLAGVCRLRFERREASERLRDLKSELRR